MATKQPDKFDSRKFFNQFPISGSKGKRRNIKHICSRPLFVNCEKSAMKYPKRSEKKTSSQISYLFSSNSISSSRSTVVKSKPEESRHSSISKETHCDTVEKWLTQNETKICGQDLVPDESSPVGEVSHLLEHEQLNNYDTTSTQLHDVQEQTFNHEIFGRSSLRKNLSLLKHKQMSIRTKNELEIEQIDEQYGKEDSECNLSREKDIQELRQALGDLYLSAEIRNTCNDRNLLGSQESKEITLFKVFS